MIEAKTQRFAGIRPAHRPRGNTNARQVNLTPLFRGEERNRLAKLSLTIALGSLGSCYDRLANSE